MAGLYIHIPYCRQACIYCNFHFSTQLGSKREMLEAILSEIKDKKDYGGGESLETIYFGGGTPSLLSQREIELLLEGIKANFEVSPGFELTLEANPDDLTDAKIQDLKASGINRLSIGVQSFHDKDLVNLRRAHDAIRAMECIKVAQATGINDITIDLIYGIPGQTEAEWLENLAILKELDIPHFSAYALTVEPRTQLDYLIKHQQSPPVDEEQTACHFNLLCDWARENGYEHYEISNFAKPGRYSRHNTAYWQGKMYIGLGPSAHSYNGNARQWNVSSNRAYIKKIQAGEVYYEIENLSPTQRFNEYLMTSLRTTWGCNLQKVEKDFGTIRRTKLEKESRSFMRQGLLVLNENILRISESGLLLADGIISALFEVEE